VAVGGGVTGQERNGVNTEEQLIAETAQANRALGASGQSDMVWGHASVRDPQGRGIWMKAAGWSFGEVTPDRVVLVTPGGEVLAGGPLHIEYPIHTEVMNARPDVGSVVHTHAPAAVSFAALDRPLLAISHDGVEFAEPQIARFTLTGSLINSAELGRKLAETIGGGAGCLIPQHGLVTVGPDAATAVMRAVQLARACEVQLQAMAAGEIRLWSDPAEIALKKTQVKSGTQMQAGYAFLCRQADGQV
jgi:ribulose-5-phosphate 4-epimerase/fuculose-1-phosphate aldolase